MALKSRLTWARKSYNSYSALDITVTASVTPVPSNHFPSFTTICVLIIHFLVHNLFPCFPVPISLSVALNRQSNIFFTSYHHPSLKHDHTTAICLVVPLLRGAETFVAAAYSAFVPLSPCLLFLTAALTLCKVVYPLSSQRTFIKPFSFLPSAMPVRFLFSVTKSHFRVTYTSVVYTCIINLSLQQKWFIFDSEERGKKLELKPTTANPDGQSGINISIHRQHVSKIAELITIYAALLPRRGPHIASHSVRLSVRLSVCLSVRPSVIVAIATSVTCFRQPCGRAVSFVLFSCQGRIP